MRAQRVILSILPYPDRPNILGHTNTGIKIHRSLFPLEDGLAIYSVRTGRGSRSSKTTRYVHKSKTFAGFLDWFEKNFCNKRGLEIGTRHTNNQCRVRGIQIETMHDMICDGYSMQEIAEELGLAHYTVTQYIGINDISKWAKENGRYTLIGNLPDPYGAWTKLDLVESPELREAA